MKDKIKYVIKPKKKAVPLGECPVGFFLHSTNDYTTLGYINEYGEYYIVSSGEFFWGGVHTKEERDLLMVYPCEIQLKETVVL